MQVREITNKQEWKDFVLRQSNTLFVQSPDYGEFYELMGERAWILGVYNENEKLVGGSLILSTHAKRGNFLYLPYGPVFDDKLIGDRVAFYQAFEKFNEYLKNFAKKEKFNFIKASPFLDENQQNKELFRKNGFRKAPLHVLAETTWMLDLAKSEDEILAGMKKNHRNLIRRCIKEDVKVKIKTDSEALKRFNDMHDKVAKRHNFHRFTREYVEKEFKTFASKDEAIIFESYLPDGRLDSSAIIMFFGNMANYRHSASLNLDKHLPTSYLIQWEIIKEAKKRGMQKYNLWGIAPENSPKDHPFRGITHFKKGFGGFQKDLLPCQDLPLSWKYWINWSVEIVRKVQRGF